MSDRGSQQFSSLFAHQSRDVHTLQRASRPRHRRSAQETHQTGAALEPAGAEHASHTSLPCRQPSHPKESSSNFLARPTRQRRRRHLWSTGLAGDEACGEVTHRWPLRRILAREWWMWDRETLSRPHIHHGSRELALTCPLWCVHSPVYGACCPAQAARSAGRR